MSYKKVSVYVDGFNLYHALDALKEEHLKWLDLWSLSEKLIRDDEQLCSVKYFSAYANWKEVGMRRHQRYTAALEWKGVELVMGRFKKKQNRCRECGHHFDSH